MVQSNPMESANKKITMSRNYLATYPNAKIRYHASDMALYIDSDIAYLLLPKSRSRIVGYYYLSCIKPRVCNILLYHDTFSRRN